MACSYSDTDFNLVLFSCCTFPALLSMDPGLGTSQKHIHTLLLSNILTVFYSPVPYSLHDHSVQVLVLQMACQTHFGSKLAASLSVATYWSSRFSCTMFWSAFVTKDCKQLMWKFPTAQLHHPVQYTLFICTWHTLQSPPLRWTACSQNFPLPSLPISQHIVHKMRSL